MHALGRDAVACMWRVCASDSSGCRTLPLEDLRTSSDFPINATITHGGNTFTLRIFLREQHVRIFVRSASAKNELATIGTDIDISSPFAAIIRQSCHAKHKDVRKFIDGMFARARIA